MSSIVFCFVCHWEGVNYCSLLDNNIGSILILFILVTNSAVICKYFYHLEDSSVCLDRLYNETNLKHGEKKSE